MVDKPANNFKQTPEDRSITYTRTLQTFKQPPEDRSNTFQTLQKHAKPCAPLCVHLWGALIL
eukprot:872272-Heterocapsa_arctica.AAC.1